MVGAVRGSAGEPAGRPVEASIVEIGCAVQSLAALAVHDPRRDVYSDLAAMRRAVAGMRWASVGLVRRAAESPGADWPRTAESGAAGSELAGSEPGGSGAAGSEPGGSGSAGVGSAVVGWIGDQEVARGGDQTAVAVAVLDRLLAPGAELVTLLAGQAADPDLGARAAEHVRKVSPAAEVVCYDGGMADVVLLIGVE
jgi:dihydroxyacetone kinase-like predicted kinase